MISGVLLGFGVANLIGTTLSGFMLERSLRVTLASMPLVMAAICASLATFNSSLKDIIYDAPKGDFPHPNTMTRPSAEVWT